MLFSFTINDLIVFTYYLCLNFILYCLLYFNKLENQAHVEIWKLYYHGKSKPLYYEKSNFFAHLKIANLIVLADPQLLKVQGIDVVKFNRALFEILHKSTPIGHCNVL